jgi:hypothetical protein
LLSQSLQVKRGRRGLCERVKSLPTYRCRRPTKFELPKNSKALGLTIPSGVLSIADEIID